MRPDYDFVNFYHPEDSYDINQVHVGFGDEVLDVDFHDTLVLAPILSERFLLCR